MKENGLKRDCLEFGNFRLYPDERLLLKNGARVPLTPRVLDLLIVLASHHGQLVSKENLLGTVWPDSFVEEGNINRTVSTLRKNLGTQPNGSDFIETVPKVGYRFIASVRQIVEGPEPELPALPWSTVRRPIFWAATVAAVVTIVLLGSSFAPTPFSSEAENRRLDSADKIARTPGSTEPIRLTFDEARDAYPMWTEDGRIRYQHNGRKKEGEPYIMDSDGQNQTHVSQIPDVRVGNWSPNGDRVLLWKFDDPAVYLAHANGQNEKKLPFFPGNIAWSADGEHIIFQHVVLRGKVKDWELSTYNVATEKIVNVTNDPAHDADPAFSPDGKQIVFNSNRDGNFELYLMNVDGSGVRRLTDDPAWDSHPAFSPDGTQIAFNSNREGENDNVYLMNSDGRNITRLTDWESHEEVGPGCWSPDGTRIALISDRSGNEDIYVMSVETSRPSLFLSEENANIAGAAYSPDGKHLVFQAELPDGSGELRVRQIESGNTRPVLKTASWNLRPDWSPDGSRIVFQNKVDGRTSLFSIEPDGSLPARVTNNLTSDVLPSWSPDATRIAFVAGNFGPSRLFTVNANTGEHRALTPRVGWETDPAWSPDGTKLAFACDREDMPGNGLDICLIGADGLGEMRLLYRRGHDSQPVWSPDGSRLAFVASSDGNSEIYVMNTDGSGLLRLTRHTAADIAPRWSPDGTRIVFTSNRSGKSAIYEIVL